MSAFNEIAEGIAKGLSTPPHGGVIADDGGHLSSSILSLEHKHKRLGICWQSLEISGRLGLALERGGKIAEELGGGRENASRVQLQTAA